MNPLLSRAYGHILLALGAGVFMAGAHGAANVNTAPATWELLDAREHMNRPRALVVVTPGLAPMAFQPLTASLEEAGLDAWLLSLPSRAALPREDPGHHIACDAIPAALSALRGRETQPQPVVLVGHGLGGLLALQSMACLETPPVAIATLGTPLAAVPSAALRWLAEQDLPPLVAMPYAGKVWNGHAVGPLLWGTMPETTPMDAGLARQWLSWLIDGPPLDVATVTCPVLMATGALDRIAPPESVRPAYEALPQGDFLRFGLLRLDLKDPEHGDLLLQPRYHRVLADWLLAHLEGP